MPVSLIRMVPLTSEVSINGTGFLTAVREGNSWINYSFRFKKCQKNRGHYSSILKNGSRLSVVFNSSMDITFSNENEVKDMVLKQVNMLKGHLETSKSNMEQLNEAYGRCRQLCEEYSRTFYLGTLVMDPERQRAIWAIYAWCRRTDDLVDGPNASNTTPLDLDQWEERLEDIFRGKPHDILDAALSDTVSKFHIDIQPFRDMIEGMRMDLTKSRYKNFDELYLYCYHVDATVGLMILPVLGIAPESQATTESVSNSLLKLGLAIQMANILRDVGEDARRGRVYLPQDELAQAGLSDDDVFSGKVTDKWRKFMKKQIHRARKFFDDAEKGIPELNSASRWPTWASLLFCRKILDEIEANDYDNFTRCANVSKTKKFCILPIAYAKSILPSSFRNS